MSDRTETERKAVETESEAVEEDTRPGTADLVREAEEIDAGADETQADAEREPLFEAADRDRFGESWTSIQAAFVDDPRDAVKEADTLVAELDAAPGRDVLGRAVAARIAVGQRRGRLDGGPADRAPALPLVLRSASVGLSASQGCAANAAYPCVRLPPE